MALYDIGDVQRDLKLLAYLSDALCLMFAAAVGKQDERNALLLQQCQRVGGTWDGLGGSQKNTINTV